MEETLPIELAENLVNFCENRRRVYALLSRCYEKEMTAEFAAELASCAALESDDTTLVAGFADLQADLTGIDAAELDMLAVVFNRVFFGMGPRTAQKAFPYESVYTSLKGLMMQDAYSEVLHLYRDAQFEKNPDFTEPEDHVAIELAFMVRLCERTIELLRSGKGDAAEALLADQLAFVRTHLLNWVPTFSVEVQTSAEGGFYAHLAAFTVAYLKADEQATAEVVE